MTTLRVVMPLDSSAPPPPRTPGGGVPAGAKWALSGPAGLPTGYGRLAAEMTRALDGAGMLAGPGPGVPILHLGTPAAPPPEGPAPWVAWTMWESSRISPTAVERLDTAELVIVSSKWNADVFRDSGVTRPIVVVPPGVDLDHFAGAGTTIRPPGPFVVGMAAKLSQGGIRKGIAEGARAFLDAFPGRADVRLEIKVHADCAPLADLPADPRIAVRAGSIAVGDMPAWYRGLAALLVPSKGEGWGLHTLEALACGVPVLAAKATGTAEFFDADCGWELPYSAEPARGCYAGLGDWYPPTHAGMVAALRLARSDEAGRRRKALRARDRAEAFPWERTGRELAAVLKGLEARPRADISRPACSSRESCGCLAPRCNHPQAGPEFGRADRGEWRVDAAACRKCGGKPAKVITMTPWKRPDYFRRVLDALRACDGIGDYLLMPHVEPGCDETRALVESIDFAECRPTFNDAVLGVNLNTGEALRDGFALADYVIHVEDDILLAPDALAYFEWARDEFRGDPSAFSVAAYNRRSEPAPADESHMVRRRSWFHPWGWATWRDRFARFEPLLRGGSGTFDQHLLAAVVAGGLVEVYPELSRAQNIGLESSLHPELGAAWFAEHHRLRHWAGDSPVPAAAFHRAHSAMREGSSHAGA